MSQKHNRWVLTLLGHLVSFMLTGSAIVVLGSEPLLLGPHPPDSTLLFPVQYKLYSIPRPFFPLILLPPWGPVLHLVPLIMHIANYNCLQIRCLLRSTFYFGVLPLSDSIKIHIFDCDLVWNRIHVTSIFITVCPGYI